MGRRDQWKQASHVIIVDAHDRQTPRHFLTVEFFESSRFTHDSVSSFDFSPQSCGNGLTVVL